jgi:hypothetical protein
MVLETSTGLVAVDGVHRIKAAESLGWEKIEAVHFEGDEKAARIYELTQNATRAGTTVLDRAKVIKELVREVLGKARAKELQRGGQQPGDKGVSKTARVLGLKRDDVRRCMVIGSMSAEAMAKAVKLDLDNNDGERARTRPTSTGMIRRTGRTERMMTTRMTMATKRMRRNNFRSVK